MKLSPDFAAIVRGILRKGVSPSPGINEISEEFAFSREESLNPS
jgi:hypothetical protein